MVRWIGASAGAALAGLGFVATLVHAGILEGTLSLYTVILPPMLLHLPDRSFLTDAAHGPPFLTVVGVLLIYFFPATVLLWCTWRARSIRQPSN